MKRPYAVRRQIITQTVMQYDENGNQTSYTEYQDDIPVFASCLKEECGAYNADSQKCEYKC